MRAIQITEFGGPEVLRLVDLPDPVPAEGQVVHDVLAAGVNYADTHQIEDSYLARQVLPLVPGAEFVGRTPDGVRVVGLLPGGGGYAEKVLATQTLTWQIPPGVSDGAALAVVLQGVTAWHLLRTCAHMQPGESVVVHAAAGGVGTLAVQLARRWGAGRVVAVASTEDKRELARELGAHAVVDPGVENLSAALIEANLGRGVDVVLEMAGGVVFDASLEGLAPFGRLVTFGMASHTPPSPVDVARLLRKSRAVIGFWLAHSFGRPQMLDRPVRELLGMVADRTLRTVDGGRYPLADARRAHEDIRSRNTVGKLALDPRDTDR